MPLDIKLLFGIRISKNVTLTITGEPRTPAPDLLIRSKGLSNDTAIAHGNGAWTATLTAGDHVVWMETSDDTWFDGKLAFTLSSPSTIVVHRAAASPLPIAWFVTTDGVNDPKNPWPPPFAPEPLPNAAWLGDTLQTLSSDQSVARRPPAFLSP